MDTLNRITKDVAEKLGIQALEYLAGEPERLGRFLALSGLTPPTIRTAAREPRFLSGVLEYVLGDDRLLVAFAEEAEVQPEQVARAHAVLAGAPWERDSA